MRSGPTHTTLVFGQPPFCRDRVPIQLHLDSFSCVPYWMRLDTAGLRIRQHSSKTINRSTLSPFTILSVEFSFLQFGDHKAHNTRDHPKHPFQEHLKVNSSIHRSSPILQLLASVWTRVDERCNVLKCRFYTPNTTGQAGTAAHMAPQ